MILPYYSAAIVAASAVTLYTLYSLRYLPKIVSILCVASPSAYIIIITILIAVGGGNILPQPMSAVLYSYAALSFVSLGVTLFFLKRRRNRVFNVFTKRLTPGSELDVALRDFYVAIMKPRADANGMERCQELYERMVDFEGVVGDHIPLDKAQEYTYLVSEVLSIMAAHKQAIANEQ